MNAEEKTKIREWVSNYVGIEINEQTKFIDDLGIADFDLYLFFLEFFKEFKVDSARFSLDEYTLDGVNLFKIWIKGIRAKEFTIDHLYDVVDRGSWFDPKH